MGQSSKIFCIGFQKTGTTSIMHALQILGYRVCDGCSEQMNPNIASEVYEICDRLVPQYDAFEDLPWPVLYKYLDQNYPGSKFILTTRPPEKWIKSISSHFKNSYIPMHEWVYGAGYPFGHELQYLQVYQTHNQQVLEYFKDRPQDLFHLPLDKSLSDQELWAHLCHFLDKPIPQKKFPYANRKSDRIFWNHLRRIKHRFWGKQPISILGIKIGRQFVKEDNEESSV